MLASAYWMLGLAMFAVAQVGLADDEPDLELLEYIVDWQDASGAILDPDMFDDEAQLKPFPDNEVPDADYP